MEIKKHYCSFSEAIREGAKLRPQGRGFFYDEGKTCAFGAGKEAAGGDPHALHYSDIYRMYPYLQSAAPGCPACDHITAGAPISGMIFHLNDDHEWTREAIADWLESEEEKLGYVLLTDEPETCNTKERVARRNWQAS